jgi:hypothetical protein
VYFGAKVNSVALIVIIMAPIRRKFLSRTKRGKSVLFLALSIFDTEIILVAKIAL